MQLSAEGIINLILPEVNRRFDEAEETGCGLIDIKTISLDKLKSVMMYELCNRRIMTFYDCVPSHESWWKQIVKEKNYKKIVNTVWDNFNNRVDLTSLLLHYLRPDEFFFYRKIDVNEEILEALAMLAEDFPELDLGGGEFRGVSRQDYEQLNVALQEFARRLWPDGSEWEIDRYKRLCFFIYRCLPELYLCRSKEPRYWLGMASDEENIEEIINLPIGEKTTWSSTKEAQIDDIYFVYCTAPEKSIRAVFQVIDQPLCDPFGGWKSHWIDIKKIANVHIPFGTMRSDEVLSRWSAVRRQFQGVVLESVPPIMFNRFREIIMKDKSNKYLNKLLLPADLDSFYLHGEFESEAAFEDDFMAPMLKSMGLRFKRQHHCEFHIGSSRHDCRIDFIILNNRNEPISLIENKKSINTKKMEQSSYYQGRSYALQLGLRSFFTAAPEGLQLFTRGKNELAFQDHSKPTLKVDWEQMKRHEIQEKVKELLFRFTN